MEDEALVEFSSEPKKKLRDSWKNALSKVQRVPQNDVYHLNWVTDWAMFTRVGFDASFDSEWTFFLDWLPKIIRNRFWDLSTLAMNLSGCMNHRSKIGFVTPTRLLGEHPKGFEGSLGRRFVVWPMYSDVEQFSNDFALRENLLTHGK